MSSSAKKQFDKNISVLNDVYAVHEFLQINAKNIDSSMILRSQFVLIVSAFDTYVHSFLTDIIIDRFFSAQDIVCDVSVSLNIVHRINCQENEYDKKQILMNALNEIFSKDSFQAPKSVEYAYGVLGYKKIWQAIGTKLSKSGQDIKDELALLVKRRNMIAHESDIDKITGEYKAIEVETVSRCKLFFCDLVEALDELYYGDV